MAKKEKIAKIGGISAEEVADLQNDFWTKSKRKGFWDELKLFLKRQNPFAKHGDITVPEGMKPELAIKVLGAYQNGTIESFIEREKLLEKWQRFYRKIFGKEIDLSNLEIPDDPEDFRWLIVVLKGLTRNELFAKCKEKFGAWRWKDDLDREVTSIRTTEETYAIRARDRVEADEENKGISLDACQKSDDVRIREGITLEERLVLELFYWWETGKHLDINSWTLCSGSRYLDGYAVLVHWYSDDELSVFCTSADNGNGSLRPRSVVSFEKLPEAA
ncbi:MAG TPA: hypothetical protein P5096_00665 [Patescibacteria group bacterium]|nr:hypothetical protein [Patescibacteria group bacterium]